ncbi:MAG TPA: OB-fold nucleic acid binding domain-containing protein, partial [Thermoguttaceae bacterium]
YVQVKHGRKQAEYPHPVMKEVLEETHGVMVYQEQVMRIINRLGGIELANAYSCIKAISKKRADMIAKYREQFVDGAQEKGLSKREATELFGLIEKFAGYGFNKSHSTAYALIAYMTAYLKAHWPVEFMAALLSSDIPSRNFKRKDSLVEHLEDCQRIEIAVLPPDVNASQADFSVAEGKIRFGLSAIKGCGGTASGAIVHQREAHGPFRSLFDFCERLDPGTVNRTAIESLIKAGAFDSLGARRAQQFAALDRALQSGAVAASDRRSGQRGLFDEVVEPVETDAELLPELPDWDEKEKLAKEKEVLGFYLSSHPLTEHIKTLAAYCSHTTAAAEKLDHRADVTLGGMLSAIAVKHTKNADPGRPTQYAMFDLEDTESMIRCICWPEQYVLYGQLIKSEAIVVVRGTIDKRPGADEANLIVNEITALADLPARFSRGVLIRVLEGQHGPQKLQQLYEILRGYPGKAEVQLMLCLADGSKVSCNCSNLSVSINAEMRTRVDDLLGQGNFRLLTVPPARTARNGNGRGRR